MGTDKLETNPIHLGMYPGNIFFNFMGDTPMYRGDFIQFETVFSYQNPKKSSFFDIYPSPVGTDKLETNPIHLGMYPGNIFLNFMGDTPMYRGISFNLRLFSHTKTPKIVIF